MSDTSTKYHHLFAAMLLFLIFVSAACGASDTSNTHSSPDSLDLTRLIPANFYGGETPQLDMNSAPADWVWNDPHVLKVDSKYIMYASGVYVNFSHLKWEYPERLFRFVSDDGIHWSRNPEDAVVADAGISDWDAGGMETPAVVFFGGKYHLFYTGYKYDPDTAKANNYDINDNFTQVGHATSEDGITFVRDTHPVISPSHAVPTDPDFLAKLWYNDAVGEPGPAVYQGQIYLYFTALGGDADLNNSLQVLGLIKSSDGINWSDPVLVLKPDQTKYPRITGTNGQDGWAGYSTPNAILLDDGIHLFFDAAFSKVTATGTEWTQLRLHHARSSDGESGWIQDETSIRSNSDFTWTTREIRSPDAFMDGTILRLYFAGDTLTENPFNFGIGMMSCDLSAE